MRSLALKKLRLDYEAGISPQTAKPQHELVLIEWECQGQLTDSFVQKERRKFGDSAYPRQNSQIFGSAIENKNKKQNQVNINV